MVVTTRAYSTLLWETVRPRALCRRIPETISKVSVMYLCTREILTPNSGIFSQFASFACAFHNTMMIDYTHESFAVDAPQTTMTFWTVYGGKLAQNWLKRAVRLLVNEPLRFILSHLKSTAPSSQRDLWTPSPVEPLRKFPYSMGNVV